MTEVFDYTHDGVTITDTTGTIIAVNRTFTQVTGYSEKEVLGENPRILSSGYHDKNFYKDYWQALTTKGIWQGEIWNRRKDGEVYLEWLTCKAVKNNQGKITHFVAIFSDITEHRRQEARLAQATENDRLTGLPNTASLLRKLSKNLPNLQRQWCVLLLDINNFKLVNSSYGFTVGDQLLNNIAKRLQKCSSQGLVARHSADVFILAAPIANSSEADQLAEITGLRKCLSKPFSILGRLMEFSISIGVTIWEDASLTSSSVLQEAELALHAAKSKGAGKTRFFSEDLRSEKNPLAYLQGLREALSKNELSLFYQPLIAANTEEIHALEVLLRWIHPTLGTIPPDHFIPLAERHGLMESLGHWVMQQALKQYAQWQKEGVAPACIAINVSPIEFQSEYFVGNLLKALEDNQIEPSCLELELTEGVFVEQNSANLEKLNELSSRGVNLAIDDFGTGYSSLAYLKHLPVNQLKIDRAFVKGLPKNQADKAIVESTLALCRGLKMSVVAEGVENKEQADYLRQEGCDFIQGYFYGRPVDTEQTGLRLRKLKTQQAS
ncbi:putative bifunctional diguanylate cyclase/phosphodiesterase [Marinospirillum insulare]|uniref:PAS domain S-box-containing protein/diguanylate cyclase (GGDEF) domain-containing protein n=1 Tax=Marinospirillum insulare TaxID=217169 RepID=A0ABQ5ZXS7_9GAMM|nr:GGDEF domain-containing phosphodiesterase [Marinospirillum insulare]GLR64804.1 hypothetical protein GCM10007878_22420 [Marinospirillum insulare]